MSLRLPFIHVRCLSTAPFADTATYRRRVVDLYRQYLREVNKLPQVYLRIFYQLKARDDAEALLETKENGKRPNLRGRKLKRITREVERVREANEGRSTEAWKHILEVAYGRKGKLHRELQEPFMTDPAQATPPPLIPANPKSRPPVYSPALVALITSGLTRDSAALSSKTYNMPVKRPDPTSSESIILGRNWKRRMVNAQWRHFCDHFNKTRFPLGLPDSTDESLLKAGVLENAVRIAGPRAKLAPLTRREIAKLRAEGKELPETPQERNDRHPSRWLRRRYQALLSRVPILEKRTKGYNVIIAQESLVTGDTSGRPLPKVDEVTQKWLDEVEGTLALPTRRMKRMKQKYEF
ncbi:hypothetical protein CYLTODRAFT_381776 [Cylindrobasidium torrendii FP15055 ss-10]|uniref:LYR motif-containing protein Cup1-like N-terminal domain-containing protein n=1 Tax=Cylindrobasidium torrendii FP15055 ss-10 TaxID=1314674 RepID=A0A0D7B0U0_9AGAR|nr:hypothetical protein CYLTODRAFT_381776 [Cylindrobasidium torrendii FP15055 ss-10]